MSDTEGPSSLTNLELLQPIGIGPASVVWQSKDASTGKLFAVRVIDLEQVYVSLFPW